MRAAAWEPSPGALLAWLNAATQIVMADLYTLSLSDRTVYRYSGAGRALGIDSKVFTLGPQFDRSDWKTSVGITVDTMMVTVHAGPEIMIGAVPFIEAVARGLMDNARLRVDRAFYDAAGTARGMVMLFAGRIGEVITYTGKAELEVLSDTELLDVMVPTAVYQPGCWNTLYDLNCGVSATAKRLSVTATVGSDGTRQGFTFNATATAAAIAGYLELGKVLCLTGLNAGISRTIKSHGGTVAATTVTAIAPWPFAIAPGDTFYAWPGCDKAQGTCESKFASLPRFAGQPYIPLPDTVT